MNATDLESMLRAQQDKIRDVQALLTAIAKLDPGGVQGRIAEMAEKQLDEIHDSLDQAS